MLTAAWKVSTRGGCFGRSRQFFWVDIKSSARSICLQECLSFIDFHSAECPPLGRRYRKHVDAQLSCKLMTGIWNVSNRWTFVNQKIWIADKFYDGIELMTLKNHVHMNSINHYIYLIVLRTTITVVVSNKKKKIPLYMRCWVCSSILSYNCRPVGFIWTLGHVVQ